MMLSDRRKPSTCGRYNYMRTLAMANFATKLARLNAIMESAEGNSHVATLVTWRE